MADAHSDPLCNLATPIAMRGELCWCLCSVRTSRMQGMMARTCEDLFGKLLAQGTSPDALYESVCRQVGSPGLYIMWGDGLQKLFTAAGG